MNLIVGLATEQALAGWRRDVLYAGITTLIFTLLISVGSYLIYQGQSRKLRLVAELAESIQRLTDLSTIDGLTGIANRRRFDELLSEEWRRGIRNRQSLAVAMLDVDFFKPYNDRYGHQSGDECLRQVGQVLIQHIRRAGDFVARYGGEEFVVVCAATDGEHARQLVEGIRASLETLALPHELSPFGHVDHKRRCVGPGSGRKPEFGSVDPASGQGALRGQERRAQPGRVGVLMRSDIVAPARPSHRTRHP